MTKEDAIRYLEIVPRAVEEEQTLAAQGKLIELDEAEKERAESENGCCRAMRDVSGR